MAVVKLSVDRKKMEVVDKPVTVQGFLIKASLEQISYKGDEPNAVPKLVLQEEGKEGKDGKTFTVLLGSAAKDDIELLTPGLWTIVEKLPKKTGENYHMYVLSQDTDKKISLR